MGAPSFPDAGSLHRAVEEAIGLYNVDRPHEVLGYATPEEVYRRRVVIPPATTAVFNGAPTGFS